MQVGAKLFLLNFCLFVSNTFCYLNSFLFHFRITDKILASSRPTTRIIKAFDIIGQCKKYPFISVIFISILVHSLIILCIFYAWTDLESLQLLIWKKLESIHIAKILNPADFLMIPKRLWTTTVRFGLSLLFIVFVHKLPDFLQFTFSTFLFTTSAHQLSIKCSTSRRFLRTCFLQPAVILRLPL